MKLLDLFDVLDELVYNFRVSEGGDVAEVVELLGRQSPEDPTHNFPTPGFRKIGRDQNNVGRCERAHIVPNTHIKPANHLLLGKPQTCLLQ